MVVLNACYAADQAEALRRSVDCVVGMAGAVSDEDARAYSVGFYRALGYRYSIQDAHELAVANVHGRRGTPAPELESQHRDVGGEPANALDTIEAKLLARDGVNPDELILATAPVRRRAARLAAIAALGLVAMVGLVAAALRWLPTDPARGPGSVPSGAPASDASLPRDGNPLRDARPDAPPDAPADARPDAPPDATPPSIQILEPKPGSWVPCGFPIKVRAEGDDISAVELLIDGRVVKQSAIAGTQLYSFTAPADLNVNRLVALRVRLQTGAGRLAAEASSSVWLRGHACWVRRTAIRERLLGEPNC
ncbi:MAG TPA: hypothetical protein VK601_07770, partial [Kofleriaceae bacterium]|nr:hypothetical protein [Kofleriaceae bacterium]